ncbi:MAG TPA: hypothetical protein VFP53_04270 [Sphingomicrobium sp.]|nr:hypothetical protein [Sphingomicrobium sp.]
MTRLGSRAILRALSSAAAACALGSGGPAAASDLNLFSPDSFELTAILRATATDGPRSWVDGGLGKLATNGGGGDFRIRPKLGEANLVWTPQFGWAVSGTFVGTVQGGERFEAGMSQAFLTYRPMRGKTLAFSARAGLMWPPVSLEHEGADWHVRDTATPSAINSWIGEEVRPLALEGNVTATLGRHRLTATAAVMAANDTSGTLLTFRGWALHDRKTLGFRRQPLPPIDGDLEHMQAPFTHPLVDLHGGFAHRPGYYAKLAWRPPVPVRIELFRYDNRANPEVKNEDMEWGWRTRFNDAALVADIGGSTEIRMQALSGRTKMGFPRDGRRWVDMRFRSAFVLVSRPFGDVGLAARAELFDTSNRGSIADDEYDETGWAATLAAKREWGDVTGVLELIHVSSSREQFEELGLETKQQQTRLQADLRLRW